LKAPIILRIFKNGQLVEVKQFESNQVIFGHDADVSVDLQGDEISPIHCIVEVRESGYYLCDMGSSTGTKKNGQVILDEPISSGDYIEVGQYRIQFFVGAPKPKAAPSDISVTPVVPVAPPAPKAAPVKPAVPAAPPPKLPDTKNIPHRAHVSSGKKSKHGGTFAPQSEVKDLKSYLKPTKGPIVEVIVAWKERILSTHHFGAEDQVTLGPNPKATIQVPADFIKETTTFLELKGGCRILVPLEAHLTLSTATNSMLLEDLLKNGKSIKAGSSNVVRLDQGELLSLSFGDGTLQIFVRYVPNTVKPLLAPSLDLTAGELTGLIVSLVVVALTILYMSVYTPPVAEKDKEDDQVRLAQFIYNKPPPTPTPYQPPQPTPTPTKEVVEVKPTPPPKKIIVTDKEKQAQAKGNKESQNTVKQVEAAKAAEVRPNPTNVNRPKKFTSIKQGGATKLSDTASANAQSNKDVSKVGLLSAFSGGGVRKQLDKAYSGSGELLGMANQATGTSGQNEERSGDDIGSKFKDTGAGGKGTATQGIAGVGTKGRGSGMSNYGGGIGLGGKGNVTIDAGGSDEGWEGTIDREAVRRVIRSILNQIKSCYERQLRVHSNLEGKVVIQFEIMEQGRVRSSKMKSSSMNDSTVESCVAARIREARFPEPPPGTIAVVDYPFVFGAQK
jgi:TonB family protein